MGYSIIEQAQKRAEEQGGATILQDGPAPSAYEGSEDWRDPSFTDGIAAAFENENTFNSIGRWMDRNDAARYGDLINFDDTLAQDEHLQAVVSTLPEEYLDTFREARTRSELDVMVLQAQRRQHHARTLANMGIVGNIGANIVAGLVDPVDLLVTVGTGGLGKAAMTGNTVRRVAVGAGSAAAANMAVEAVISAEDPTRTADDIIAAGVLGAVIGGGLNVRGGRADAPAARTADDARITNAVRNAGETLTSRPSSAFDVDSYMRSTRRAESSGNDAAAAVSSSAYGRYQFIKSIWLDYYRQTFGNTGESEAAILAKRADGDVQDQVMRTFTNDIANGLRGGGHAVTNRNVYLGHFLGIGDARKVLGAAEDTPLRGLVNDASIAANRSVLEGKTVGDLLRWAEGKVGASAQDGARSAEDSIARNDAIDSLTEEVDVPTFNTEPEWTPMPGAAGAAARTVDDAEYFGANVLIPGAAGRMLRTSVPKEIRSVTSRLISGLSRKDNNVREITAEETGRMLTQQWQTRAFLGYNQHFVDWSKAQGVGVLRRELGSDAQQRFMREVTAAMRGEANVSPQAKAAGKALSDQYKEMLIEAKRAGLPGFEDIDPNVNYVPRLISDRKFMDTYRKIGGENVKNLLKQAMVAKGMPDDLAERVSKAYRDGALKRITADKDTRAKMGAMKGLADDDVERLRYYLPEDDANLVDDVIAHLKTFRSERNKDAGRIDRAKRRIDMDETAEIDVDGVRVKVTDLFEDDAWQLFDRYTRTLGGWVGLAKRADIRSEADWDNMIEDLRVKHVADPKIAEYTQNLQRMKTLITGGTIDNTDYRIRRSAQLLRKANFASMMGQAGYSQIAELGNVLGYAGLKNTMMHMPALRSMWKQARTGQLDEAYREEIMSVFGVGAQGKLGRGRAGYDEYGTEMETMAWDMADRILDPAARAVGYAGGLTPLTDALHVLSRKSFLQRWANVANGHEVFTDAQKLQLADAGIHEGHLERALEAIRTHGEFDGKRLVGLNTDRWDPEVLDPMVETIDRMSRRAVQENDIGSSAWWMHTEWGKVLGQFRSFIMNAWVKQTLHAARFRDKQVATAFLFTMGLGTMSYMARTMANYWHDEEELDKRLSLQGMAKAAFSTTGYSSIMPTAIDTGLGAIGSDPWFAYTRSTGLAANAITGNPTYQRVNNMGRAVAGPVRALRPDYEYSQADYRALVKTLPFTNLLGVKSALEVLGEDLPKRSKEDEYWK